ncbi:MAG: amidohydrolase [Clostridia bacterium]|nr:amidohydrolase [Clostridia bacterium]
MDKQQAVAYIDQNAKTFTDVSDEIWEYAELSLQETRSAALYQKVLIEQGFETELCVYGLDTAVIGRYGAGRPVIGILAEYDALSGISQESGKAERAFRADQENGHGCGHHMLGAGAFAAACAVKEYLKETGRPGTVIFYGCPGEEGGAAKAFMAKQDVFRSLDAALTWHPGDVNEVSSGSCLACIQKEYAFSGLSAHAAGCPELGRSALDAVELMNIGVQFLREHAPSTARIHYAITESGGLSPNVVQPKAKVLYMVRDETVHSALALQARVDKIAQAAAMMTETTLSVRFIDGCADVIPNNVLEKTLHDNFSAIPLPEYDEQDWAYAKALQQTYLEQVKSQPVTQSPDKAVVEYVNEKSENGARAINDFLIPLYSCETHFPGSTDVGDVSWQTPTAQINTATYPSRCPGHSWQNVAIGKSPQAHKGLLMAGKVIAATAIDLLEQPNILAAARAEFEKRTVAGYACPIPDGAKPEIV